MSAEIGEIFATLRAPLSAYLRKQVHDPDVAEDLLLQVFVKALTNRSSGRKIGNLDGWLYAVARRSGLSISAIKSRSARGRRLLKATLLECCNVELGSSGKILDYYRRSGNCCHATCS